MVIVYIPTIVYVAKSKKSTFIYCNRGEHNQHNNPSGNIVYQTRLARGLLYSLPCDFGSCSSCGTTPLTFGKDLFVIIPRQWLPRLEKYDMKHAGAESGSGHWLSWALE
jgi:hypothetical protein